MTPIGTSSGDDTISIMRMSEMYDMMIGYLSLSSRLGWAGGHLDVVAAARTASLMALGVMAKISFCVRLAVSNR